MRTTIDLPDDLFRRAKATATIRGLKFKDLMAKFVEQGLNSATEETVHYGQHRPIPVVVRTGGLVIPAMTNQDIDQMLLQQDMESIGKI